MSRRRMLMVRPKASGKTINRISTVVEEQHGGYFSANAVAEFPIASPQLQVLYKGAQSSIIYEGETVGTNMGNSTGVFEFIGFQLDWGDMETLTKEDENYIYVYEG